MLHGVAGNLKLHKRVKNILWCCEGTQTYITFAVTHHIDPGPLWNILHDAYQNLMTFMIERGDGVMVSGSYDWPPSEPVLRITNANNHQTTWGVMAAAIYALADWMHTESTFGGGFFDIYDGQNQVGTGTIRGLSEGKWERERTGTREQTSGQTVKWRAEQ